MGCVRGRAEPDGSTRYRLFAESAGRCQNPGCLRELFVELPSRTVHVAEVAHIIAAGDGGPRGEPHLPLELRAAVDNLILLCPTCHTVIDKAEHDHPVALLRGWKAGHQRRIDEAFSARRMDTRAEARAALLVHRRRAKTVFDLYGPLTEHRFDPDSEVPALWREHVHRTVLPTNRAVLRLLDHNQHLLRVGEWEVVELFRVHVEDFERRHRQDPPRGAGLRYPDKVDHLFAEEGDG
ncbi:hypothetical protein [Actinokineospora globicatena]|uniref:hypothetical protein n=1 Tax=Actinokineospora globicatena TaxID=103729 RepID=UPI0020A3E907|nr:hypothetical protein [Actinokineospora globicatena]MCP2303853.1 hypothetical protein [Actinokineospora globicatena]GLW78990.1 hypothetical protein Aglo01_34720 [Actinokineospora globicatena]GLW86599.1 hypothetical protein Aglo02_42380 [Actinokineospora globicatena]